MALSRLLFLLAPALVAVVKAVESCSKV